MKLLANYPADGNPLDPSLGYPLALVAEIAEAVHEEGGRVAIHVMGPIAAATTTARAYLGLHGLEPGAPADLVTYAADPREDLGELRRPAAVLHEGELAG